MKDTAHSASDDETPGLKLVADQHEPDEPVSSPDRHTKTLSGTLSRASVAAAAAVQLPQNARRRIAWDSQLRLHIFWLLVFWLALGFFWGWRFQQYSRGPKRALFGPTLPWAKACGNAMKIVIWPVLILPLSYVFTTSLRDTWIDRIVPFDAAVPFHMMVAATGGLLAIVHAVCHIVDYAHAARQPAQLWAAAFPDHPEPQTFAQLMNQESTYVGFAMLATLTVMFAFALPYPRKCVWLAATAAGRVLNNYNWFWTTHKIGGGIFYTLLILHPLPGLARNVENPFALNPSPQEWGVSDTWVYISLPIAIRLADRAIRWWRRNVKGTKLKAVEFMADGIVALEIGCPPHFHFRPGMFIYLNVPAVAEFEWHPLSLAGAPSASTLAVLVRSNGDWGAGLQRLLRQRLAAEMPGVPGPLRSTYQTADTMDAHAMQARALEGLQLRLDGPFGAPAAAYTRFPVVLLVGAGIGITPFLSILADAVERRKLAADRDVPAQGCVRRKEEVQKVHFHWLVREPAAPRWLRQTMETAAAGDTSGLLDVNIHMTKARSRAQSYQSLQEALGATQAALDADAAELGDGTVAALNSTIKAWPGRPDFEAVFVRLARDHPGDHIGVFYCGPPGLSATLSALCLRHSAAGRRGARFHFRAERFG